MAGTRKRTLGAALVAGGVALLAGGFALAGSSAADPVPVPADADTVLHAAQRNTAYQGGDCGGDAIDPDLGPFAWHFVVPSFPTNGSPDLVAVTAEFQNAGLVENLGHVAQKGKAWYLFTPSADVLVNAWGFSDDPQVPPVRMVLSHTCGPDVSTSSSSSQSSAAP